MILNQCGQPLTPGLFFLYILPNFVIFCLEIIAIVQKMDLPTSDLSPYHSPSYNDCLLGTIKVQIWSRKFSAICFTDSPSWCSCCRIYLSNLTFYPSPTHILDSADAERMDGHSWEVPGSSQTPYHYMWVILSLWIWGNYLTYPKPAFEM